MKLRKDEIITGEGIKRFKLEKQRGIESCPRCRVAKMSHWNKIYTCATCGSEYDNDLNFLGK